MTVLFPRIYGVRAILVVTLLSCVLLVILFGFTCEKTDVPDKVIRNNMACVASSLFLLSLFSDIERAQWKWTCVNDKCIKSENVPNSNQNVNQTLEFCKLTCGPYGSIWPRPTGLTILSKNIIPIHPETITFDLENVAGNNEAYHRSELMSQMSQQFIQNMKTVCSSKCIRVCDTRVVVKITTNSLETDLNWKTDESYQLRVNTTETRNQVDVDIQAATIFGARHALQTLFQLTTVFHEDNDRYLYMIDNALIIDKPAYPHRGLLIDTSRHYLQIETIKRTLDGMGHSKMNVLHWHATDSHSFPLKLPRVPEMAKYGAYSLKEAYTLENISYIINYAKIRGVRVIIEIDSPAHAGNGWQWGEDAGLGALAVCVNKKPWQDYCIQPPCGQLNPVNPNTYKVLAQIYKDLTSIFPKGEIFHMGGDELTFDCWNSTSEIVDEMIKRGLDLNSTGFLQLWANFHKESLAYLDNIVGKSQPIILWSSQLTSPEIIVNFLSNKRLIVQTWLKSDDPTPATLLELNYTLIMSTKDAWYLDHGFWGVTKYYRWNTVYDNIIPDHSDGVLGGEVCMWGEYVDDSNIDSRIWPRAAAAAERLWTNPKESSSAALTRFLQHRRRLVQIGIMAEAITPEWCYQNDDGC